MSRLTIWLGMVGGLTACGDLPSGLHRVVTTPKGFEPSRIEIAAGDSIVWEFAGEHNALFLGMLGTPDDIPVSPAGRYLRSFTLPGRFEYRCTLHPGMDGMVIVR